MKNLEIKDDEIPDFCFICYSYCLNESCNWSGWLLDGVFSKSEKAFNGQVKGNPIPHVNQQICPRCRAVLFRTDNYIRFDNGISSNST